jgi:hypothetical protein
MINKVVTGGQAGADRGGWRAAKSMGIATAGWMPPLFASEDGKHPEYAEEFGAQALDLGDYKDYTNLFHTVDWKAAYRDRTYLNAEMSDACVYFGRPISKGYYCTYRACIKATIEIYVITRPDYWGDRDTPPLDVWLMEYIFVDKVETLFVAGNRESKNPGISSWVERYMIEVFRRLGHAPGESLSPSKPR